jgi:hypothetical protein
MMEEEEPLADGDAPAAPTMFMPSPVLPTKGQETLNDCTVSTASAPVSKCSEPTFSADQAAPMDVQQCQALEQQQPEQHAPFLSG